jgi:competence protein ComFB
MMINVDEEIVGRWALDLMAKTDMCRCEKCYKDVCAIALNSMKGHYVTTKTGEAIASVNESILENKVEQMVAVTRAIELVRANPMHVE